MGDRDINNYDPSSSKHNTTIPEIPPFFHYYYIPGFHLWSHTSREHLPIYAVVHRPRPVLPWKFLVFAPNRGMIYDNSPLFLNPRFLCFYLVIFLRSERNKKRKRLTISTGSVLLLFPFLLSLILVVVIFVVVVVVIALFD